MDFRLIPGIYVKSTKRIMIWWNGWLCLNNDEKTTWGGIWTNRARLNYIGIKNPKVLTSGFMKWIVGCTKISELFNKSNKSTVSQVITVSFLEGGWWFPAKC